MAYDAIRGMVKAAKKQAASGRPAKKSRPGRTTFELSEAQKRDYEIDSRDANLEMWLSDQGRHAESEAVYQRRLARMIARGDRGYVPTQQAEPTKEAVSAPVATAEVKAGLYTLENLKAGTSRTFRFTNIPIDSNFVMGRGRVSVSVEGEDGGFVNVGLIGPNNVLETYRSKVGSQHEKMAAFALKAIAAHDAGNPVAGLRVTKHTEVKEG